MVGSILFVCLGNTCRSPMAEGLFRSLLQAESKVAVDSAGTRVRQIGVPPDPRAQAAARERGIDISDLQSRQVTEADVAAHDLVFAMDEASRQDLLLLAPESAQGKVRLLLDFAPGYGLKEIPDPFHGGPTDYEQALDLIEGGCAGLLAALPHGPISPGS